MAHPVYQIPGVRAYSPGGAVCGLGASKQQKFVYFLCFFFAFKSRAGRWALGAGRWRWTPFRTSRLQSSRLQSSVFRRPTSDVRPSSQSEVRVRGPSPSPPLPAPPPPPPARRGPSLVARVQAVAIEHTTHHTDRPPTTATVRSAYWGPGNGNAQQHQLQIAGNLRCTEGQGLQGASQRSDRDQGPPQLSRGPRG
jgi:hypothetical protein